MTPGIHFCERDVCHPYQNTKYELKTKQNKFPSHEFLLREMSDNRKIYFGLVFLEVRIWASFCHRKIWFVHYSKMLVTRPWTHTWCPYGKSDASGNISKFQKHPCLSPGENLGWMLKPSKILANTSPCKNIHTPHTHAHTHAHMHTHMHTYRHRQTHAQTQTDTDRQTHTHTHTQTHTHTHTQAQTHRFFTDFYSLSQNYPDHLYLEFLIQNFKSTKPAKASHYSIEDELYYCEQKKIHQRDQNNQSDMKQKLKWKFLLWSHLPCSDKYLHR